MQTDKAHPNTQENCHPSGFLCDFVKRGEGHMFREIGKQPVLLCWFQPYQNDDVFIITLLTINCKMFQCTKGFYHLACSGLFYFPFSALKSDFEKPWKFILHLRFYEVIITTVWIYRCIALAKAAELTWHIL